MKSPYCLPTMICLLIGSIPATLLAAEPREWTSRGGTFKVTAELVSNDDKNVTLKKLDGKQIEVPIENLSTADRDFLRNLNLPPAVTKFREAMESLRDVEAARLKLRIDELKEHLRLGAKDLKQPIGQEALALSRALSNRLGLIQSGAPFIPRLSPRDLKVGQIGDLDDNLMFSCGIKDNQTAVVSVTFDEMRYKPKFPVTPNLWHHMTVSRPDSFTIRAPFVPNLAAALKRPVPAANAQQRDKNPAATKILRSHVYEVIETKGLDSSTLVPFQMDDVQKWLKEQAKR